MKQENYWEQFMSTGKVEDYLRFRKELTTSTKKESAGDNPYAGVCHHNGNDIKDSAYRRIR